MTIKEKLDILEDLLDVGGCILNEDTELDKIRGWDSMAVISTIAMLDSDFGKVVTSEEVKRFKTIKDITDRME